MRAQFHASALAHLASMSVKLLIAYICSIHLLTACADLVSVKVSLITNGCWAAYSLKLSQLRIERPSLNHAELTKYTRTFRLGTFLTLSGYFFTYFFLPLRECRAQTSFVWSLKRGGTALEPCVSPLTNSTIFSSSSRRLHA